MDFGWGWRAMPAYADLPRIPGLTPWAGKRRPIGAELEVGMTMMREMLVPRRVAFLGGNGHCASRLEPARRSLPPEIALIDIPYPGFEGRPRAGGFPELL